MREKQILVYDDYNNLIVKTYHSVVDICKRPLLEHHHTECELSLFIEGSGKYWTKEKEYDFQSGDMFLFGSNEPHCITEITEKINLLNIHFEPYILWENPDTAELTDLFNIDKKNFINKFPKTDDTLKNLIINIENEADYKNISYKINIKSCIYLALVHILRNYNKSDVKNIGANNIETTKKIKDAILFMNDNLSDKITLREIAGKVCMAETYFSAVFKKLNGISPWDYIKIKRVENAVRMLKTTNLTKLDIAEKCGFQSSSNFYKIFKEITGKTPNQFKKNKNSLI